MQVVDKDGNVYGQGLQITSIDGKPKTISTPGGTAGGDLSGTYPNPSVVKLLGNTIPINANGYLKNDGSGGLTWGTISTGITVNTTPITGGTSGRLLFDNAGVVGETNNISWNSSTNILTLNGDIAYSTYNRTIASSTYPLGTLFTGTIRSISQINHSGGTNGLTIGGNGGSPIFRIWDNGNVTIQLNGTYVDAGYRLDVAGSIRTQSSLIIANPLFTNGGSITHSANATLSIVGGPAGESIVIGPSNRIFINAGQTRFPVGSVQIGSSLSVGAGNTTTATMLWVTGGITASSLIARGISLDTTLAQSAANDVLTAVNIAPTFTVNNTLFHDVYWARITGSYAPAAFSSNNNATTIDLSNSFTNTNNAIGIRIRHTYSNVQNGYGILLESASFIGIAQTSTTSNNFFAGTTVIGSSVAAPAAGYTLHVTNGTNGAIKVGNATQGSEHLVISHSQAGSTFSSIRNTYAVAASQMLIDVGGQGNLRLFGTGNVTIGSTTDAGYKLDVAGTTRLYNAIIGKSSTGAQSLKVIASTGDSTPVFSVTNEGQTSTWFSINGTNGAVSISAGTTIGSINISSQIITIPIDTGSQGLANLTLKAGSQNYLNRAGGNLYLQGGAAAGTGDGVSGFISFSTTDSTAAAYVTNSLIERARITIGGNLLIGTTTDAGYKLDVNGTSRFTGNIQADTYIKFSTGWIRGASNQFLVYDSGINVKASIHLASGTSYFNTGGNFIFGSNSANASAIVQADSVTQGFLPPRMSNTQMLAIATPSEGLMVYDTTNRKLCCYDGVTWQPLF